MRVNCKRYATLCNLHVDILENILETFLKTLRAQGGIHDSCKRTGRRIGERMRKPSQTKQEKSTRSQRTARATKNAFPLISTKGHLYGNVPSYRDCQILAGAHQLVQDLGSKTLQYEFCFVFSAQGFSPFLSL